MEISENFKYVVIADNVGKVKGPFIVNLIQEAKYEYCKY